MIVSDLGVTLRQNELAEALVGDHSVFSGPARSMIYRWFTEPERRGLHPAAGPRVRARQHVASLRAVHGRPGPDPEADELVEALLAASEEFAALWARHEVGRRTATEKRFVHPLVGELTLDCQNLDLRRTSPSGWSSSAPRRDRSTRRACGCWPSSPPRPPPSGKGSDAEAGGRAA